MFLSRDITRQNLRDLVRRGLKESRGRYKELLTLFGMTSRDYRRFMNFLAAHECGVSFREFRGPSAPAETEPDTPVYSDASEMPAASAARPH